MREMSLPTEWPYRVKSGNVTVPIYRSETKRGYTEYKTVWTDSERKRRFKTFADFGDAKAHAATVGATISAGDAGGVSFSGNDRLVYLRSLESVKPFGVPLDHAAAEYAGARTKLGKHTISEAVEFFLKSRHNVTAKTVSAAVADFISEKRKPSRPTTRPASERYLKDLELRLGRFVDSFHCNIGDVTAKELSEFLDSLKVGGRSYFNYARTLLTLFNYAKLKKFYPADANPFEGLEDVLEYEDESEIEIFTPAELQKFLNHARPKMVPFLVIGAFSGLRHAEIQRLEWIDIKEEHIEVTRGKAKTRQRRLVPIQPNLQQWLAPYRQKDGKVVPIVNVANAIQELCAEAKAKWRHNALRHSFISYRFAITKNENSVAAEAGNSPAMIFRHYRELVTETDAKAWFSVGPQISEKIVPMVAA
jgi:integrase